MAVKDTEPKPLGECPPFEEWDFEALAPERCRSKEYDDHRLRARRKLGSIAKALAQRAKKEGGIELDTRTSLHHPHAFNGNSVKRLWAYITRAKKDKAKLKRVLGADLAKDLDQAYKNAYLCVALETDRLEVSYRIHPDGWYDGQNLVKRIAKEGVKSWQAVLDELEGFTLRLHDWRGTWRCGALEPEQLEEYLKHYTPGEHRLTVERSWPATAGARDAVLGEDVPRLLEDELMRLLPLHRWTAWTPENDHLFS